MEKNWYVQKGEQKRVKRDEGSEKQDREVKEGREGGRREK